jgi:hypothetical protein
MGIKERRKGNKANKLQRETRIGMGIVNLVNEGQRMRMSEQRVKKRRGLNLAFLLN